jgi:hypothetical protein
MMEGRCEWRELMEIGLDAQRSSSDFYILGSVFGWWGMRISYWQSCTSIKASHFNQGGHIEFSNEPY